ncbi:PhoX family protein [Actinoalloteichus fjordicus]|uniref:Phosphatase n=1 Tax=Actinoalloteichus fjordicus TaxID=1612552 RepID=A0AAC9LKP1_9PSEU|nr:putative phosphatase [Actinoalloteichus fjordicus]APU24059.1 putative phosphatase [Actinoalloteichus sp. GBA129-24]
MPTPPAEDGRIIPLTLLPTDRHGSRASITCRYRCGDACGHEAPNTSSNPYFGDVVTQVMSRRGALRAAAVVTIAGGALGALSGTAAAETTSTQGRGPGSGHGGGPGRPGRPIPGTDYSPVEPNTEDAVVVPEGYRQNVVIRWGDPVVDGAPEFDFENQTAAAQALQFGYNCDFAGLIPLDGRGRRNLLVVNHEYSTEPFMFRGYDEANPTEEQVKIAWAAHGLSVVLAERDDRRGGLSTRASRYNRRITATTEFEVRGPVAGSDLLKTAADPSGTRVLGTLNNCAGSVTPWGTVLSGEENFNQYFGNADQITDPDQAAKLARYGISGGASERRWERFDSRFDVAQELNETHRFGWVVEIDPHDPDSTPVKHTALGRFKHEGAAIRVAGDGRVVAYSGDDERFDYIYKFVSKGRVKKGESRHARRHNMRLLDEGTLYVARFTGDSPAEEIDGSGTLPSDGEFGGAGEWIALAEGDRSFVPGMTAEEVYVYTRIAGDKVGATKMDRPEDIEPNPVTGSVYAALTNNTNRGATGAATADEANPRNNNKHGHVLEWTERRNDPTATRFTWNLLLVCGDPESPDTYFGGFDKSQVSPITSPDNVAFDRHGNLWISTDSTGALGINDGLYSVPVQGSERGHLKLFLTVPRGGETCGPVITEDLVTVCVQHPGEVDGASVENPASNWPDRGDSQPRPSVVSVWRTGRGGRGVGRIGE